MNVQRRSDDQAVNSPREFTARLRERQQLLLLLLRGKQLLHWWRVYCLRDPQRHAHTHTHTPLSCVLTGQRATRCRWRTGERKEEEEHGEARRSVTDDHGSLQPSAICKKKDK